MQDFKSAIELLNQDESALVVFTKGLYLTDNHDGTCSTGWWKIDPHHKIEQVIIYRRADKGQSDNDLFIGKYNGVEGPNENGRYMVHLIDFKLVGQTDANWREFADTHSKEFRYVSNTVKIEQKKNPNWNRDELLLALELYLKNPKSPASKTSVEVSNLSEELNRLQQCLGGASSTTLRNVNGVYLKMMNFRRFDPEYTSLGKKGMTHGNKLELIVWNEFSGDKEKLAKTCRAIREALRETYWQNSGESDDDGVVEASEGKLLTRMHKSRERSRKLVIAKKKRALKEHGTLACEVCNFEFSKRYGNRGDGFIECHHTKPVNEFGDGRKTTIDELALVCANCHRMIHSKRPWLAINELKMLLS